MLTKRQDWLDLGDSGAYEYRFEGLGFSRDAALALAAGAALEPGLKWAFNSNAN